MDTTSIDHRVEQLHRVATHKAMLRLIPLMCAIYFMSFLDRTNVALAKTWRHTASVRDAGSRASQ